MPIRKVRIAVAATAAGAVLLPAAAASAGPALERSGAAAVSICSSVDAGLARKLSSDIQSAVRGRQGVISVSVYDRRSGTTCNLAGTRRYQTASIVKVSILSALLRKRNAAHKGLTAAEKRQATAMITRSDNAAANALWKKTGASAFRSFLVAAGMKHTAIDGSGYWGKTRTTAADQVALLKVLTKKNKVLTDGARSYVLSLMAKVVPSQRWGTPAGAPSTVKVHVKNGWVNRGDSAKWRINSIGAFTGNGRDYMLVVLTQGNPSQAYGHDTIGTIAQRVHQDLR